MKVRIEAAGSAYNFRHYACGGRGFKLAES